MLSAGVDGLLLETFYDLEEMLLALRLIRKVSDIPVICQFAVEKEAVTQDGHPLELLLKPFGKRVQMLWASIAEAARMALCVQLIRSTEK